MGRHPQSRTSQSEVYGVFENVCPNLTSGRERIALTHLGGGIWTTVPEGENSDRPGD